MPSIFNPNLCLKSLYYTILHTSWCLWWFKDEEFQAIHNAVWWCTFVTRGVYDGSKMKNFKQFTTFAACRRSEFRVSMMVQRWRISSNSQLSRYALWKRHRCLWWFKDEEFQAIHNVNAQRACCLCGVYDGSKMKNFKQFTTSAQVWRFWEVVSMMVQRWRISSNSQLGVLPSMQKFRCLWWFKDEEFQAIHN